MSTRAPSKVRSCRFTFWRRLVAMWEWLREMVERKPRLQR